MTDDLLDALGNNENVIPVIGFEMLPVKLEDGKKIPYLDYFADLVSNDQSIPLKSGFNGFEQFNYMAHELLKKNEFDKRKTSNQLSTFAIRIHDKVDTSYIEKVVAIAPFKYFFNLTFTTHLEEVIAKQRSFVNIGVKQTCFAIKSKLQQQKPQDLILSQCNFEGILYNLIGIAYNNNRNLYNFYTTDDDLLEFICEFTKRYEIDIKNYNEIVKESSLLFIGCQYPDWLTRILINTLKPGILNPSDNRQARIFFDYCNNDSNSFFLTRHKFRFQRDINTLQLIDNAYDLLLSEPRMYIQSIKSNDFLFISYTRDNIDLVQKIICQLSTISTVWFDRIKLFPGSIINDDIKEAIRNCKYFLPVITERSVNKDRSGYVRQEWIFYTQSFSDNHKLLPLIHSNANNGGHLGFDIDKEFKTNNVLYVSITDSGISEDDLNSIKNKLWSS